MVVEGPSEKGRLSEGHAGEQKVKPPPKHLRPLSSHNGGGKSRV